MIAELRNQGYLNDNRFSQELIRGLINRKPVGRFYLLAKLKDHGVPEDIARAELDKAYSVDKERELGQRAAQDKAAEFEVKLSRLSYNQKAKISHFLNSRGFGSDVISDILDNFDRH